MAIALMICFARSGGTVLNQCLGSLPKTIVLSEVNPLGSGSGKDSSACRTVKEQALRWYSIPLKSEGFTEECLELEQICSKTDRELVVRDWSFVNFVPTHENNYQPPKELLALKFLSQHTQVKSFAFVRDAIDVWISRNTPDNTFFLEYLNYVKAILEKKIPIFKYEDFCNEPSVVMSKICHEVGLTYDVCFKHYKDFTKVNGDIQIVSRGNLSSMIKSLKRKKISKDKVLQVNRCPEMIEANNLLGYPTSYSSRDREGVLEKLARKILII